MHDGDTTAADPRAGDSSICRELVVANATATAVASPFKLPDGWTVKKVPRADGIQKDKYYYEPGTGRKFRSLKDVERHLTGAKLTPKALKSGNRFKYYYKRGARRKVQHLRIAESYLRAAEHKSSSKASQLADAAWISRARRSVVSGGRLLKLDNEEFDHHQLAAVASYTELAPSSFILPDGWVVEEVPRRNCNKKDKTHTDKYYYEPGTGRRFYSLISVKRHLEEVEEDKPLAVMFNIRGDVKKIGWRKKFTRKKVKTSTFGPAMPPDKIRWVLADDCGGSTFKPYIGEEMVADPVVERWANRFMLSVNGETHAAPRFEW